MVLGKRKMPVGWVPQQPSMKQRAVALKAFRRLPLAKAVASVMRSKEESGFVDVAAAAYANNTTGTITLLNTVAQGASTSQRIGKKIALQSIQIRGNIESDAAAVFNDVANLIVYDKRPTGALPAITAILNTATSSSFNNDINSGRFRIVRRWDEYLVGGTTLATTPYTEKSGIGFDHFVSLKGMKTVYKALGTGAIDDIEEGALYFVTVGNTAAGTADAQTGCGFRLRYRE